MPSSDVNILNGRCPRFSSRPPARSLFISTTYTYQPFEVPLCPATPRLALHCSLADCSQSWCPGI